jgi:hypothetical protein
MNQKFLRQVLRVIDEGVEGTMTHQAIAVELRRRGERFTTKKLERAIDILHGGGYLKTRDLSDHEFWVLRKVFAGSPLPGEPMIAPEGALRAAEIPPGEEGWTLAKDEGDNQTQQALRALFNRGLIEDSGWRRRGERDPRYLIVWVTTALAVKLYGEELCVSLN